MRTNIKQLTASLLAFTMLTACTSPVGPQESGIETPSIWSHFGSDEAAKNLSQPIVIDAQAEIEQQWWKRFDDPTLDALIGEALTNNKSLAIAKARVEEARAGRTSARAALIEHDDLVVAREFGDLMKLPHRAPPCRRGKEKKRRTLSEDLVGNVGILQFQNGHVRSVDARAVAGSRATIPR